MSTELLACPFDRGIAVMRCDAGNEVYDQSFWIECKKCGARSELFWGSNTWSSSAAKDAAAKAEAAAWWNRRTPPTAPPRVEVTKHAMDNVRDVLTHRGYMVCANDDLQELCTALSAALSSGEGE